MPQEPHTKNPSHRWQLFSFLGLILAAAFVFTYSYLEHREKEAADAQAAAAATALRNAFAGIRLEARSAYVVDLREGRVLFERNSHTQLPLASLTKIALVLAVAEVLSPDTSVSIPPHQTPDGAPARLIEGDSWKTADLINFTLITSSNEGADILAKVADSAMRANYPEAPAGSAVLWRMNELVKSLHLTHTYFLNVTGLDESLTQAGAYGSAGDYATLISYAASTSLPVFAGTARNDLLLTDESGNTTEAVNTNEALGEIPGLIMGKTGFTDLAGGNLAIVFDVGLAHPVAAVVLGSSRDGRFSDMRSLVQATRDAITSQ